MSNDFDSSLYYRKIMYDIIFMKNTEKNGYVMFVYTFFNSYKVITESHTT